MATSSSGGIGGVTGPVWLYVMASGAVGPGTNYKVVDADGTMTRVAQVFVQVPLPDIVVYQGLYYSWSAIRGCYLQTTPYQATAALPSSPLLSPVANPVF